MKWVSRAIFSSRSRQEVNSTWYSEIEEPIKSREKHYSHVLYILKSFVMVIPHRNGLSAYLDRHVMAFVFGGQATSLVEVFYELQVFTEDLQNIWYRSKLGWEYVRWDPKGRERGKGRYFHRSLVHQATKRSRRRYEFSVRGPHPLVKLTNLQWIAVVWTLPRFTSSHGQNVVDSRGAAEWFSNTKTIVNYIVSYHNV